MKSMKTLDYHKKMIEKNNQRAARIDHTSFDKLELKKLRVAYNQKTINSR